MIKSHSVKGGRDNCAGKRHGNGCHLIAQFNLLTKLSEQAIELCLTRVRFTFTFKNSFFGKKKNK